jgi:peptidyl-prolyl cis-trans isomerase D
MMQMLRKAAVAVMFGILIVAFAISMGGNNYFDRYAHPSVAKVGSIDITPQQYERVYQRTLDNLSARSGQRITSNQAKTLGLPQQVLQGLIQESALDYEANKLGLGLSPEGLRQNLTGTESFQDNGKFSPEKYQQFLQRIGYSAPGFEQEFRGDLIRRQIQAIFMTSGVAPKPLLDAFNRYLNEERVITYFTLAPAAAGEIAAPSEEALKTFYEERKTQFMAPEFRKVSVLAITPQTVASRIDVPEEEVKAKYDANPANYAVPEKRKIELIPFKSKEAAEAAEREISGGKDFAEVAKAAGFQQGDIDLGDVSKKELGEKFDANKAILDTAFGLKKGEVSQPVNGPLSWVILRVDEIAPGKEEGFDAVKAGIRESILKAKGATDASKLTKQFEDERASGLPLQDIAKKLNLPAGEVTIDRRGNGPDGKLVQIASVPADTLAGAAFKSEPGVENEALRVPGGGYAWYDVEDIVKARQKPFDEVKADVEASWRKDQIRTKLAEKARDLMNRISHGEAMADAAKSVGAEVKTTQPVKRAGSEADIAAPAISQAFSLPENTASSALGKDGESRLVFEVTKVIAPGPLNAMQAKNMEQKLSGQIAEDNFAQYLIGVEKAAGVSVDRKNFDAVMGGGYDAGDSGE